MCFPAGFFNAFRARDTAPFPAGTVWVLLFAAKLVDDASEQASEIMWMSGSAASATHAGHLQNAPQICTEGCESKAADDTYEA